MKTLRLLVLCAAAVAASAALAQDPARGARLYAETPAVTGKPVGACVSCHADVPTLRELIANQRVRVDDPRALARWLGQMIAGAQPGAANAKAQYRGVLTEADLRDLAAYIARAKQVSLPPAPLASAGR